MSIATRKIITAHVRSLQTGFTSIEQSWMDAFTAAPTIMGNRVPSLQTGFISADSVARVVCFVVRPIMDNPAPWPKIDIISTNMKIADKAEWEQKFVAYFQDGLSIPLDENHIPNPATWTRLSRAKDVWNVNRKEKDWRPHVVDALTVRNFSLSTLSYYDVKRASRNGFKTFNSTI